MIQAAGIGAVGLWVWGAPRLPEIFAAEPSFTPIANVPPFRRLNSDGALTAANVAFLGLDQPNQNPMLEATRIAPCTALFRGAPPPAIALFSDFNCPNCPTMDANVTAAAGDTPVVRHQLPLLGVTSETASRAVLAADLQGGFAAMYAALSRTPAVKNLALIRRSAVGAGLDSDRLVTDMQSVAVQNQLNQSLALARILGLIGTPATVIGRTIVLGTLPRRQIAQIIALEQELGEVCA